jgi:hypothetical protein
MPARQAGNGCRQLPGPEARNSNGTEEARGVAILTLKRTSGAESTSDNIGSGDGDTNLRGKKWRYSDAQLAVPIFGLIPCSPG